MAEFYLWPHNARIVLVVFAIAAALLQTATALLSLSRIFVSKGYRMNLFDGITGTAEAFCVVVLLAQVQQAAIDYMIVRPGYAWLRWTAAAAAAICAIAGTVQERKPAKLLRLLPAVFILPAFERLAGGWYPWFVCAALLLLSIGGICFILYYLRSTPDTPSSLSVKEAIDSLHTGILFGRPSGRIVLTNRQMHRLMLVLTGASQHNGNVFYQMLKSGNCRRECRRESAGDQIVYSLPDGSVWMFRMDTLELHGKKYFQLSAGDITEYWQTGVKLKNENEELINRREMLNRTLTELRGICRREEHRRARLRVHDVLGQKISLLLRTMQESGGSGGALLEEFAEGLPKELLEVPDEQAAQNELDILRRTMATIGVNVSVSGALPEETAVGTVFAGICTEAATNAVRHGIADEIAIVFSEDERGYTLRISDNGCSALEGTQEGGGIRGMREKLERLGGTLEIAVSPLFTLTAKVAREHCRSKEE